MRTDRLRGEFTERRGVLASLAVFLVALAALTAAAGAGVLPIGTGFPQPASTVEIATAGVGVPPGASPIPGQTSPSWQSTSVPFAATPTPVSGSSARAVSRSKPTPPPVLRDGFGAVAGGAGITVSRALTVRGGMVGGANGVVTVNDDGTRFTIAAETTVGSDFDVGLALCNAGDSPLNGELQLSPEPARAGATAADDVTQLARFGRGTWKFTMGPSCDDHTRDIILTVEVPSDLPPGFQGFQGTLRQVAF